MYVIRRSQLLWTNRDAGTGLAPDAPDATWIADISDVGPDAVDLQFQIDTTATLHTAASIDLNIFVGMVLPDNTISWDSAATQAIAAVADNVVVTHTVTVRGDRIKVTLDNNSGASKAYVTVNVRVRRRRF
jgi:hypothetical protein